MYNIHCICIYLLRESPTIALSVSFTNVVRDFNKESLILRQNISALLETIFRVDCKLSGGTVIVFSLIANTCHWLSHFIPFSLEFSPVETFLQWIVVYIFEILGILGIFLQNEGL